MSIILKTISHIFSLPRYLPTRYWPCQSNVLLFAKISARKQDIERQNIFTLRAARVVHVAADGNGKSLASVVHSIVQVVGYFVSL